MTAATRQSNADRLLAEGLAALGIADAALADRLSSYLDLVERWNRTYNLTAVRDRDEMVTRHLIDSLVVLPFIGEGALADLGSGAGLPGIPLAMARPGLAVTLVEAIGKKARFLREAGRQLGLSNVRVAESRAESLDEPGRYHCLTARAFGTLAELLRVGGHLLAPGGRLLALKGQRPDEEIAGLPPGWRVVGIEPLTVPGMAAQRHLVIIERDTQQGAAGRGQGAE
ncbi:MAG: 16S rRNA (guanine(527)-N(7))-methyltransferase RsmG [Gammaproteobacteria bacterium HGW-Gammaproteobacteria-7]|nr:MAG: 16S rRNA (guanine(527)-N(7))-methyltransferase RsmG [Gammaproteobacteria bacterium HGW-Gammaproteobacteria-7]